MTHLSALPSLRRARVAKRRFRSVGPLAFVLCLVGAQSCIPKAPTPAAPTTAIPGELIITAIGLAEAAPDMTKVTVTIHTQASTAPAAAAIAARRARSLTAALERIGLSAETLWSTDFRTIAVTLPRTTDPTDSLLVPPPARAGMAVEHTMEIAVDDISRSGAVIDAIQGIPDLTIDRMLTFPRDLAPATRRATDIALEHATSQAESFVRRVGAVGMHLLKAESTPMALDSIVAPDGGRHIVRIRLTTTWALDAPTSDIPAAAARIDSTARPVAAVSTPTPAAAPAPKPTPKPAAAPSGRTQPNTPPTTPAPSSTARPRTDSVAGRPRTP